VPEAISSVDGSGGNQDQTGPKSETSVCDEAKHYLEKGLEEVAEKRNKAQGEETEIRVKAVASSQQQPNQTVQFGKFDYPVSPGLVQKVVSQWCPPGLTHSQRRRIQ
jgi:hypothetical protein